MGTEAVTPAMIAIASAASTRLRRPPASTGSPRLNASVSPAPAAIVPPKARQGAVRLSITLLRAVCPEPGPAILGLATVQGGERSRNLLLREARRDVLRAIPIERFHLDQE